MMTTRKKEAEITQEDLNEISSFRGGKLLFYCPDHKPIEIYCICEPIPQENPSMIACDHCDNWFHFNCVGLGNKTKEGVCEEFAYYLCYQCKDWLKYKQKIVKFDKKLMNTEGIINIEEILSVDLLPKEPNLMRFRLADALLIYRMIIHRINKILRNPPDNSLEIFLKQMLEILSVLPFKVPKKFDDLKKAKYLAFSMNFLLENNAIKILDEMTIQSCLSTNGEFLPEKYEENLKYKHKISNLEEIFTRKGLDLKSKLLLNKHKSLLILDWILEYHSIFSMKNVKKPSLDSMMKLKQQIDDFSLEEGSKFLEIQILKEKLIISEKTMKTIENKLLLDKNLQITKISEKNYENFDDYLKEVFNSHKELIVYRLKNVELNDIEEEIKGLEFEWPALNQIISEEKEKIKDWIEEFKGFIVFKGKDFEKMINKMDNLITQTPEMLELLEIYKEYKRWNHEFLMIKDRFAQENSVISIQEIEDLIEKTDKRIDFEENMEFLKKKLRDFDNLKKKIQGLLEKPMEITVWNRVKKEFGSLFHEIHLEEIKEFEDKIRIYKEISQGLTQKKFTFEKLDEFLEKARNFKLDEKLIKEIEHKVLKAKDLKQAIDEIMKKKVFDYGDSVNISNLLLEIKQNKLDFEEISSLKSILDSFEFIEKIHKIWLENQPKNEKKPLETQENPEKKSFSLIIEEICDISRISENLTIIHQEIKPLITNFDNLQIFDENLKKMLNIYKNLLWNYEAQQLYSKKNGQLDGEALEILYKESKSLAKKTEMVENIENLFIKYSETKLFFENSLNSLEKLFENPEENTEISLGISLETLEKELKKSEFFYEEIPNKLKILKTWFEWLQKASELLRLLKENREIDFESSSKLISLGQKMNFPLKSAIFVQLQSLFDSVAKYKEKFLQYSQEKRKAFEALKTAKAENSNRKKFFDLNKTKPKFSEIEQFYNEILSQIKENPSLSGLLRCETSEIDADLSQIKEFLQKYEGFKGSFIVENLKGMSQSEFESLKTEIMNYRQESFWNLGMYLKDWDQDFSRLEMKFHGFSILFGLQKASLVFLKNYLKFAEDSKDETLLSSDFMCQLKEIFNKAKELTAKIEDLKNIAEILQEESQIARKDFISEKELEEMMENMKNSVINFGEFKGFLEDLSNKFRKCKDFYEKNQLKFPDYDFLQSQVKKHEILQKFLEKSRKFLQSEQIPLKIAETLLEKYSESRILINEYEKLQEKYNKSSLLMEELERKLTLFDDFLPQSYEEYQELSTKFENIGIDFGDRTLIVRVLLFKQKVHFLEEIREKSKNLKNSLNKVSFKQLKHDLQYGYSLLLSGEIIEKLQNQIKSLENLLLEIGDKFKEIEEIKNTTILEDYNPIFLNFVDLSEELIEYKMALAYEKDARISFDLGVHKFFDHYIEGSDSLKILKNMGISPCNRGFIENSEISRIFAEENAGLAEAKERAIKKFAYLKENFKEKNEKNLKEKNIEKLKEKNTGKNIEKNKQKNLFKEKTKESKEENRANLGKRKINPTSFGNEFITGFLDEEDVNNAEKTVKKIKKEGNLAIKPSILKPLGLKEAPLKEFIKEKETKNLIHRVVTTEKREEIMNKLDKLSKSNPKLKNTNKDLKSFLQILENQIFGTFHNNFTKYEAESQSLIRLFEKLLKFPFISANLLSKNFRVEIVQKLMKNIEKLSQIETNLKAKEQEKLEKTEKNEKTEKPEEKIEKIPEKPKIYTNKPLQITKKPGEILQKKVKSEQYDPFEKSFNKKPLQTPVIAPKEDPLKEFFRDIKENSQQNAEKKSLSLLALTENSRGKALEALTGDKSKTQSSNTVKKHSILEKYEALSSDDDKQKKIAKNEGNSSKKEEKKLEFSDDESNLLYEKFNKKQRYSLDNSEDSFDNLSRSSGAYDPLTEIKKVEIEQPILFDPDNEDISGITEKYNIYTQKFAPKGSILKIFEGKFRLNHMLSIHANFLTIDEISTIRDNFPKILLKDKNSSLKLSGTTDFKAFSEFYFVNICVIYRLFLFFCFFFIFFIIFFIFFLDFL